MEESQPPVAQRFPMASWQKVNSQSAPEASPELSAESQPPMEDGKSPPPKQVSPFSALAAQVFQPRALVAWPWAQMAQPEVLLLPLEVALQPVA